MTSGWRRDVHTAFARRRCDTKLIPTPPDGRGVDASEGKPGNVFSVGTEVLCSSGGGNQTRLSHSPHAVVHSLRSSPVGLCLKAAPYPHSSQVLCLGLRGNLCAELARVSHRGALLLHSLCSWCRGGTQLSSISLPAFPVPLLSLLSLKFRRQ